MYKFNPDSRPFFLCHPADSGGCGYYRVLWPADALLKSKKFHGLISDKLFIEENLKAMKPSICLLQRQYYPYQIQSMRMYRKHIPYMIYELDDILDKVPGWSIHHHQMPDNVVAMLKQAFSLIDRVTTTTPFLADQLRRFNRSVDIRVVPNYLPEIWRTLKPYVNQGKIRVGWAGALAHKNDLQLLYPIMEHFGDRIEWVFMGYAPESIPSNCQVQHYQGAPLANYPFALNMLNLDVGLAPLEVNILNRSKSGIRVMELGINGCAMITTDLEPYQDFKNITRLQNDPQKWVEVLEAYIKDRDLAKAHGAALRQEILSNHILTDHLDDYEKAWGLNSYEPISEKSFDGVSIVIPVQKHAELTKKCLDSVLASLPENTTKTEIIVVQDAAETEVRELVGKYRPQLKSVINHFTVKGFSNSINDGIKESLGDVIILNSDCVVYGNWVDNLKSAAYSSPQWASVTPMGTDDSFVSVNLEGVSPQDLNLHANKEFKNMGVEIGTPVGFCMFMKRNALREVGLFDADGFPKIYGEENDWGCRALLFGHKHLCALNTVVGHVGNTTYVSEENQKLRQQGLNRVVQRFPFYANIVKSIEPLQLRHVKTSLELSVKSSGKPSIVMIGHNAGGGIETYLQHLGSKIINENWETYVIRPSAQNQMLLTFTKGGKDFKYPEVISTMDGTGVNNFCELLAKFNCKLLVVNTLVQYPHWMDNFIQLASKKSGIPYDVVVHDMYYWCPQLNMVTRNPATGQELFCNSQSIETCKKCVANGTRFGLVDIEDWRNKYGKFLFNSRHIHATSHIFMNFILTYFPNVGEWDVKKFKIHPHPEEKFIFNQSLGKNIAVLGHNILPMKGSLFVQQLAKAMPATRFVIFGNLQPSCNLPNVVLRGTYANLEELQLKLKNEECSMALFLSTWPEIFLYSMSDAIRCGLQPIVFDLGMQAERICAYRKILGLDFGLILPESMMYVNDVAEMVSRIENHKIEPISGKIVDAVKYNYLSDYFGVLNAASESR